VLNCEPLHDIKGHLANLFEELPNILADEVRKPNLSGEKVTGADLYTTSKQVLLLLTNEGASSQLILLLTTIVKISEILYSDKEIRTPTRVLQLYNTTWLHLELCRELFPSLQKINQTRFFGISPFSGCPFTNTVLAYATEISKH